MPNQRDVLRRSGVAVPPPGGDGTAAGARQRARWFLSHGLARMLFRAPAQRGEHQAALLLRSGRVRPEELAQTYAEMRAAGTFYKGSFGLVAARHAVVKEVLTSGDFVAAVPSLGRWVAPIERLVASDVFSPLRPPSLLAIGPPDHTRYRSLISRAFTPRAVRGLRGGTEDLTVELLDGFEPGEGLDLVERYCRPMPLTLVCDILGIEPERIDRIKELGEHVGLAFEVASTWQEFQLGEHVMAEFDAFIASHIAALRDDPGPDLLSRLIGVSGDGDRLSGPELVAFATLVFSAGFETTVNLIGAGIALLTEHPDQLEILRADPELWPNAVDEILRLDTPSLWALRAATCDTSVAGRPIKAGTTVPVLLAAANRDPAVFPDPDRFDVTRPNATDQLGFSAGRHYCFGAVLARLEASIALRELFERYDVELLPGARRRATRVLHGWERLPAVVRPRG